MRNARVRRVVVGGLLVWGLLGAAQAQTNFYWTNSANGGWNTAGNWTNGAPAAGGGTNYVINFLKPATTVTTTNTLGVGGTTNGFLLNSLNVSNVALTIYGSNLVFITGGAGGVLPTFNQRGSSNVTLNVRGVMLSNDTTFGGSGSGTVLLNSNVFGSGALIVNMTNYNASSGNLQLNSSNSYSGGTVISNGIVWAQANSALGSGTVVVTNGAASGSLYLRGSTTNNNALTLSGLGSGGLGALRTSTGTNLWGGTIALAGTTLIGGAANTMLVASNYVNLGGYSLLISNGSANSIIKFTGIITNAGSITLNGTGGGELWLSGANTYSGGTTNLGGALRMGSSNALGTGSVLLNGGTLSSTSGTAYTFTNNMIIGANVQFGEADTYTGSITNSGYVDLGATTRTLTVYNTNMVFNGTVTNGGLDTAGSGTLVLGGANTISNAINVGGTSILRLNHVNAISNAASVTVVNGAQLLIAANGTYTTPITLTGFGPNTQGALRFNLDNGTMSMLGPVTLNGDSRIGAFSIATTVTFSNVISGVGNVSFYAGGAANTHLQTFVLATNNTYSGNTTQDVGAANCIIQLGINNALPTNTLLVMNAVIVSSKTNYTKLMLNGYNQQVGGLVSTVNPQSTNRVVNGAAAASTLTINNTDTYNFAGFLGGPGANENNFGLLKLGGGTQILSGTNSFSGGATISNGVLLLASSLAVSNSVVTLAVDNGLGFSNITAATLGGLAGTGNLTLTNAANAGVTLALGNNNSSTLYSGVLSDNGLTGALTKVGSGILTLTNANTYGGRTTISAGTLSISTTNALPGWDTNGRFIVASNAALAVGNALLDGDIATLLATTNFANGARLGFDTAGGNRNYSVVISNTANGMLGLVKISPNTLTLTGTNTYTGPTVISNGTLQAGSSTALGLGSAVTMAAGSTLDLNGYDLSIANLGNAAATITNTAAGTGTNTLTITGLTASLATLLIADDANRQIAIAFNNNNGGTGITPYNSNNTFSGGMTLLGNGAANGARLALNASTPLAVTNAGGIVNGPFGRGPIIVGQSPSDKAGIYISGATTLFNDIVVNSGLGTDVSGTFRFDAAATLVGTITANLADVQMGSYNGSGVALLAGQVTGPYGLHVINPIYNSSPRNQPVTVTLSNITANANDYAGASTVDYYGTLALGLSDQIPNGVGKGDVTVNGTLKLNGNNETINGLVGTVITGVVEGVSGMPILTVGDNNATASYAGTIQNTAGTLTLVKIGNGVQTLAGTNTYDGGTLISGGTLQLGDGATRNGVVAGNISNNATLVFANPNAQGFGGVISGSGMVIKNAAGVLTLSNANTYGGGTIISNGVLLVNTTSGLATGPGTVTLNGGTLGGTGMVGAVVVNQNGHIAPGFSIGTLTMSDLTLNSGSQLDFEFNLLHPQTNDLIIVTNLLTIAGGGFNLYEENTNTAWGTVGFYDLIQYGSLLGAVDSLTVLNPFSGRGYQFSTNTTGWITMEVFISSVLWTGLGADANWQTGANWSGALSERAFLEFDGSSQPNNTNDFADYSKFAGIRFTTNATAFVLNGNIVGLKGAVINSSTNIQTINLGLELDVPTVTFNAESNNLVVNGVISGSNGLMKTGAFILTLGTNNIYSGGTTINAGMLALTGSGTLGANTGSLLINGATSVLDLGGGSITQGVVTLGDGIITNGTLMGSSFVVSNGMVYAVLAGSGAPLTKAGSGTVTLAGANTYTGDTVVNNGILILSNSTGQAMVGNLTLSRVTGAAALIGARTYAANQFASNAIVTLSAPDANAVRFDLQGFNQIIGGLQGNQTNGNLIVEAALDNTSDAPATLTINTAADANFLYRGYLRDAAGTSPNSLLSLVKLGQGTQVFSGAQITFTGGLTINGGAVVLTNTTAFGSAATINGGQLLLATATAMHGMDVTNFVANGLGFLATNAFTIGGLSGSGDISLTNNAGTAVALTINNTATGAYSGVLSGSGSLTKTGAGLQLLTGSNSYTGGTFLNAGTLNVTNDAALGAAGVGLTFNGGTLQSSRDMTLNNRTITLTGAATNLVDAGTTLIITNDISGAGALIKSGDGTLILGGIHTNTGAITLYQGTVNLTGSNSFGTAGGNTDKLVVRSNAVLNISGDLFEGSRFRINYEAGTTSIVNQTTGTVVCAGDYGQLIGNIAGGAGVYNLSGGVLSNAAASELVLGVTANATAIFNMLGGTLSTPTLEIGRNTGGASAFTTNYFNQSGGTATVSTLYMGGATNTYTNQISNLIISNGVFSATTFTTLAPATNDSAYIYLGTGAVVTLPAFPARNAQATATITFDGGVLSPSAASLNYMSNLTAAFITTNGAIFNVASGNDITIAQPLADTNGPGILIKQGVGMLTLSGANTYSGGTTISDGTLQIGAGGTVGSVLGTITNNGTLAYNRSDNLTDPNPIVGVGNLIKNGSGTLILSNTYSFGAVTLSNGTLSVNADANLGGPGSAINFNGGFLQVTGTTLNNLDTHSVNWSGFNGGFDIADVANTLTVTNNISGAGALTKAGAGTLILSGANSYAGATAVKGGILTFANTSSNAIAALTVGGGATNARVNIYGPTTLSGALTVGSASGDRSVVLITNNVTTTGVLALGSVAGSAGAGYQTGGAVSAGSNFDLGKVAGAYGYYGLNGGRLTNPNYWLQVGTSGLGVFDQYGGTNVLASDGLIVANNTGTGIVYFAGGVLTSSLPVWQSYNNSGAGSYSAVTITTNAQVIVNNSWWFNKNKGLATSTNYLNLVGGVLQVNTISKNAAGGLSVVSFNGGTLRAGASGNLFGLGTNAPDATYIFGSGAILDSSSYDITIAQNLLAPTGSGVVSITLSPLSGYIGAPYVAISGGGGTGATAIAQFDYNNGTVTGIVMTSAGVGYTNNPVVTLIGGGNTNYPVDTGAISLANNTSGGLTKLGAGVLTLSGTNTYGGGTIVSNGALSFANTLAKPSVGTVNVLSNAALGLGVGGTGYFTSADVDTLWTNSAALGITMDPAALVGIDTSAGNFTYGTAQSTRGLVKLGANTLTLTNANTYTGPTLISAGTLQLSASGNLGDGGAVINYGTLLFSRSDSFSINNLISGTGTNRITSGGTLNFTGSGGFNNTGALILGDTNSSGNFSFISSVSSSHQIGSLSVVSTNINLTNTVTIGSGQTLAINGAGGITVGFDSGTNSWTVTKMTGGGALVVTNTSANVIVGKPQGNQARKNHGTLDLSGLSSVTLGSSAVAISELRVGYGIGSDGALILSDTNNLITATTVRIGYSVDNNGGPGTIILGAGTNVIAADLIQIGLSKADGSTLKFASQAPGSTGTVTIGGKSRATTDFRIGDRDGTGTGTSITGTLDLRGHSANVAAGTVTLGKEDDASATYSSGTTGYLYFDKGTFNVSNLIMAAKSGASTGAATATLVVGGSNDAVFTVNPNGGSGGFSLASQTGSGSASGTLTLSGGVFRSYAPILEGGGTATSTINLYGGTLDMMGTNIGNSANPINAFNLQSGVLQNLGEFNGGAPLVKTTSGTLVLAGNNTYSGGTTNLLGTLALGSTSALGSGVLVMNGGALAVTNGGGWTEANIINLLAANNTVDTTGGALTLSGALTNSGALTKTGAGTLTLAGNNTYSGATVISNGTLAVGINNALPTNTTLYADSLGGILDLNSHSQQIGGLSGTDGYRGTITDSVGGGSLTVNFASGTNVLAGSFINVAASRFTLTGGGTLLLTGTNGFGTTVVSNGSTYVVNGRNDGSLITVYSDSRLKGSGTIGAAVSVLAGGTLQGGNSPGLLTFTNGLTLAADSTNVWQLLGNDNISGLRGATNGYSAINVTGGDLFITTGSKIQLEFNAAGSAVQWTDTFWDSNKSWNFMSVSGGGTSTNNYSFGDLVSTWLDVGGQALTNARPGATFGASLEGGNVLLNYTAIPEPGTASLLGLVGVAFLVRRLRRRAQC